MGLWKLLLRKLKSAPAEGLANRVVGLTASGQADPTGVRANLAELARTGKTIEFIEESARKVGYDVKELAVDVLSAAPAFADALARDIANTSDFLKVSGTANPGQFDEKFKGMLPEGWLEESLGEIRIKNSGLKLLDRGRAAHLLMLALQRNPSLADGTTIEHSLRQVLGSGDMFVSGNAEEALDILRRANEQPHSARPRIIKTQKSTASTPATVRDKPRPESVLQKHEQRVVRVFVSSTFRDMQAERDELVRWVFPKLRKLCEERGVTWGHVDLRWGITDEQRAEGKVLPICLAEIGRCRPYFLGLLGERYGSPAEDIPDTVIEQQPWLAKYRARSVTELEILSGVLNKPTVSDEALFYFRDAQYRINAEPETPENSKRLYDLKKRIRESGMLIHENYPDPKALGELVYQDLKGVIDKRFPVDSFSPLDRDAAEHEFFAESRLGIYVDRPGYFDTLDQHVAGDGAPLVVIGQSGGGKSALLANWGLRYREAHKESMVLLHFVGSTPQSSDWTAIVRRILGEIRRKLDIEIQIPEKSDLLAKTFSDGLRAAAAKAQLVLVLDGLNQLDDRDGAHTLAWLPVDIPSRIRLVISTLPGASMDEVTRRGWPVLRVLPLDVAERKELIFRYLHEGGRTLAASLIERISGAGQSDNPLYLRMLLDELLLFGSHEHLSEQIDNYMSASGPAELADKILERYERDYESARPGLVRDAMTLIWAARRGLSEVELLDQLSLGENPLPQAYWTPLYLAADRLLISRSGLINFAHDYFREAVKSRYIADEASQRAVHSLLADYFESRELGPRKIDELPWQLSRARLWHRVADVLSDLPFFIASWGRDPIELKMFWAEIRMNSSIRPIDAYRIYLDQPEKLVAGGRWLAYLLSDQGYVEEAAELASQLIVRFRQSVDYAELERCLDDIGTYFRLLGRLDEAIRAHKEAEALARQFNDFAAVSSCIGNQAIVLTVQGKLDDASRLLQQQEIIKRSLGDMEGLSINLGNRAQVLQRKGDYEGALALHREEETLCRRLGDHVGLASSLTNQASALTSIGDTSRALQLLEEAEELCRGLNDLASLQVALGSRVRALAKLGNLNRALSVSKEQERICKEISHKQGLAQCLSHQGDIYGATGHFDQAIDCLRQAKQIYESLGDSNATNNVLESLTRLLSKRTSRDKGLN